MGGDLVMDLAPKPTTAVGFYVLCISTFCALDSAVYSLQWA